MKSSGDNRKRRKSDGWLVDGAMVKEAYTPDGYWVNDQGVWEP